MKNFLYTLLLLISFIYSETILVPEDFTTIQEAIDYSIDGDSILVSVGTYEESLSINKSLTLQCPSEECLIDASDQIVGIDLSSNNIQIIGFEIIGNENTTSGIIIRPNSYEIHIYDNVIHGMSHPHTDEEPFSYGILCYGISPEELAQNLNFIGNDIYNITGAGIAMGEYLSDVQISENYIHDLNPVEFLGHPISFAVGAEFTDGLTVQNNIFENLYIGSNILTSEADFSENTYQNVDIMLLTAYSYISFGDLPWFQIEYTLDYDGEEYVTTAYLPSFLLAIEYADEGSTIFDNYGNSYVQDCADVWGGDMVEDCLGVCGGIDLSCYIHPDAFIGLYLFTEINEYDNSDCTGEATTNNPSVESVGVVSTIFNEDGTLQFIYNIELFADTTQEEGSCNEDSDCYIEMFDDDCWSQGSCGVDGFCDIEAYSGFWGLNESEELLCWSWSFSDSDISCIEAEDGIECFPYIFDYDLEQLIITQIDEVDETCALITLQMMDVIFSGCMDSYAFNYNPEATVDNGSCDYMGDLNNDNQIDVLDVILLVNYILDASNDINTFFADLNEDENIDILDIIFMINIILGNELTSPLEIIRN